MTAVPERPDHGRPGPGSPGGPPATEPRLGRLSSSWWARRGLIMITLVLAAALVVVIVVATVYWWTPGMDPVPVPTVSRA